MISASKTNDKLFIQNDRSYNQFTWDDIVSHEQKEEMARVDYADFDTKSMADKGNILLEYDRIPQIYKPHEIRFRDLHLQLKNLKQNSLQKNICIGNGAGIHPKLS